MLAMMHMVLLIVMLAGSARATVRADFFDATRLPTVTFDQKTFTWTLRNQAVERVVRFDPKIGRLQTVSFRTFRSPHPLIQGVNGEGELQFVAGISRPPTPLVGWKLSANVSGTDWTQAAYDDSAWKPTALPYTAGQSTNSVWLRCALPAGSMNRTHAYALLFDHAISDSAEVYVDGELARKITAEERPGSSAIQVDLQPTNRVVAVKLTGSSAVSMAGTVSLAEVGTAPPPLDLNSDWQYSLHTINANEDGSRVLTISLLGINKHEGLDLDINYQIYPGAEPTIAKWFTFVSHRQSSYLIEQVTYDRWVVPGAHPTLHDFPGTGFVAHDPATGDGLFTAVLSPQGVCRHSGDNRRVTVLARPYYPVKPNTPQQTPHSLTGLYHGPLATGAFLYQLYIGQYVARATADSVPAAYNTSLDYGKQINEDICTHIIPIARELGIKLFVLGDGWQTNIGVGNGTYGDWIVDRTADDGKRKFPKGLLPVSDMVRESRMRFGLWTAPILVNERSQAATDHANWLLRHADGTRVMEWPGTVGMCFASGWADTWGSSLQVLCRELDVSYLRLDGELYHDNCASGDHDHPICYSANAQKQMWADFSARMLKVNTESNFIIDRGTSAGPEATGDTNPGVEAGPELTDVQDTGRFNNPTSGETADTPYKDADACRAALYDLVWTRPSFTLTAITRCHSGAAPPDLNALEYEFTSAGAYVGNVELQGRLDAMTPTEIALIQKWVRWNADNRPWLAYTQPLPTLGRPDDPRSAIDGVLHLRNALHGRYGYLCLWNRSNTVSAADVTFDPADYYVRMKTERLEMIRLKDGKSVPFSLKAGAITLDRTPLAPRSWEIYELREKGAK